MLKPCSPLTSIKSIYNASAIYDRDTIVEQAEKQGMKALIPPSKNRKVQHEYDRDLYCLRHLVENAFLHLKHWRSIATRFSENASAFSPLFTSVAWCYGCEWRDDIM